MLMFDISITSEVFTLIASYSYSFHCGVSLSFLYFFTHLCYDFFYFLFTTCLPHCYLILHPHVILTLTHAYSISCNDVPQHD